MPKSKGSAMSILSAIATFLRPPKSPPVTPLPDPEPAHLGEEIAHYLRVSWFGRDLGTWVTIPRVKCHVHFNGWGFVEGRTRGIRVNQKLTIVEGDEDMEYTTMCILLSGLPLLRLTRRGKGLYIDLITGPGYFLEDYNHGGLYFGSYEDFLKLPAPLQKVLRDVLVHVYSVRDRERWDLKPDPLPSYLKG